jgi:single-stranded DNA-binding protein
MCFVQGDLNVRPYTTKDGRSGTSLDVTIDKFQFAGGKKEDVATSEEVSVPSGEKDDSPF